MIKVLKISAEGLPLYDGKCEINFINTQRTTSGDTEGMFKLSSSNANRLYTNNIESFFGINASGKTTILRLISFVFSVLNNEQINNIKYCGILGEGNEQNEIVFDIVFVNCNTVNLLHTVIKYADERYTIIEEYIKSRKLLASDNKTSIFDFSSATTIMKRKDDEQYLVDDMSIIVGYKKAEKTTIVFTDMLEITNINRLKLLKEYPLSVLSYFDPKIECINTKENNGKTVIYLKFRGEKERILYDLAELNTYLSSGTIKGINVFGRAISLFETGGYLIIDDLENHFNHEIVSTLIRFFTDKRVNPHGATLIFSTHYSELLEHIKRNDCIYIVENKDKITITPLNERMQRNDENKVQSFKSGLIGNTAPSYEAYIQLKKSIINKVEAIVPSPVRP